MESVQQLFGVKVENIDDTIPENLLRQLFKKFGRIHSVKIPDPSKRVGYVNFFVEEESQTASIQMNGHFANGNQLRVTMQRYSSKSAKSLADCKYKDKCTKDGCQFRHLQTNGKECKNWQNKKCRNGNCPFSHPVLTPEISATDTTTTATETESSANKSTTKESFDADQNSELNQKLEQLKELYTCSICCEVMESPKTLQCTHSFCKECLEKCESFIHFDQFYNIIVNCPLKCEQKNLLQMHQTIDTGLTAELSLKQGLDFLKGWQNVKTTNPSRCTETSCSGSPENICKSCGDLMCSNCSSGHSEKCLATTLIPVKYSQKDDSILAYCNEHRCFCHFVCTNCDLPVCMYCKKWSHSIDHTFVSMLEYGKKFDGPLRTFKEKAESCQRTCRQFKNQTDDQKQKLLDDLVITKRNLLAKLLFVFEDVEKSILTEYDGAIANFEKSNNSQQQECQKIINGCTAISQSSIIEKITKTKTLKMVKDNQIGELTVDVLPSVTQSQLDINIKRITEEAIGTFQLSLAKDVQPINITPKLELVFDKSEFQDLQHDNGCKDYLTKAGITFESVKLKKPKKKKKQKLKENVKSLEKEDSTMTAPSVNLIDFDYNGIKSQTEKPDDMCQSKLPEKAKKPKKKKESSSFQIPTEHSNLINFEDDENEKSFVSMLETITIDKRLSSDEEVFDDDDDEENSVDYGDFDNEQLTSNNPAVNIKDGIEDGDSQNNQTKRPRRRSRGNNPNRRGFPSRGGRGAQNRGRGGSQNLRGRGRGQGILSTPSNMSIDEVARRPHRGRRGVSRGQTNVNYRNLSSAQSLQLF